MTSSQETLAQFINNPPNVRGRLRFDVSLDKLCWFKVGGKAAIFFSPADIEDLQSICRNAPPSLPIFVLGLGSNTLVRDGGFPGLVIRLGQGFTTVMVHNNLVTAGAAASALTVAKTAAAHGIGGCEFLSGIPGSVGGVVSMNAGAYDSCVAQILVEVTALNYRTGEIRNFSAAEMGYTYRSRSLAREWIFVEASFTGPTIDPATATSIIAEIQSKRLATQPIHERTGGSTFKNPAGVKAWQLINDAGCRGLRIGGASVSEKHCNFFINEGSATAADLDALITEVQRRVLETSGVMLEPELVIIGEHTQHIS